MQKNKFFMLATLITVLGLVAAATLAAGRGNPAAQNVDAELLIPPASGAQNPVWKAQPGGQAVNLPWANTRVNSDTGTAPQNEPTLAVNPSNPRHLVAGANTWEAGNGNYGVKAYASFDGGATWTASEPYVNRVGSRLNAADPTVAFGADGAVYFAFVAMTPAEGAVAVSRSTDGGLTWTQSWATSFIGPGADKPMLAVGGGKVHVYYQSGTGIYGRNSTDGATWSSAGLVDAAGRYAAPVVDSAGNVNVFYMNGNNLRLARQTADGAGYKITTVAQVTPLQARQTQYRAAIYPAAGVDGAGNLYVAWADGRNVGRGNDILLSRSVNGGRSWSAPVSVSHDTGAADQLFPALAVEASGAVNVLYLDNRNDAGNVKYDMYVSRAADGVNFGTDLRVSNVSSHPGNDPQHGGRFIGDYNGVAAADGVISVVWGDTRNGNLDIMYAPVAPGKTNH